MPRGGMREMNVDSLRQPRLLITCEVKYNTMLFTRLPTKVEPQTSSSFADLSIRGRDKGCSTSNNVTPADAHVDGR